jgi:hypothetical protein
VPDETRVFLGDEDITDMVIPPVVAPAIPVQAPVNKADAAWERLLKLRDEARALGIDVDDSWPAQRLVEEIAAKS